MGYVHGSEIRLQARVPIINISHINGLECDVSVGIKENDTTDVIKALLLCIYNHMYSNITNNHTPNTNTNNSNTNTNNTSNVPTTPNPTPTNPIQLDDPHIDEYLYHVNCTLFYPLVCFLKVFMYQLVSRCIYECI